MNIVIFMAGVFIGMLPLAIMAGHHRARTKQWQRKAWADLEARTGKKE